MKALTIIALAAAVSTSAFAQNSVQQAASEAAEVISGAPQTPAEAPKPKYWKNSAVIDLGVNNTQLKNWAAGGYNTTTLSSALDAQANYAKGQSNWTNRLQLNYGFIISSDKEGVLQKNNDRIYLQSKWAYKAGEQSKWYYTASYDFQSQFSDTPASYEQDQNGKWKASETIKSSALSPAYTNVALGLQWTANKWFDVNIAPLTGGFTIVTDETLRQSYGMQLACDENDAAYVAAKTNGGALGGFYRSALFQFGAQVKANVGFSINDNIKVESQAVIFTDYLAEPYFRINWDNSINWQLSKFVKLAFKTWMISDPNVQVEKAGEMVARGAQWKEFLSFNFTYSFATK